MNKSQQLDKFLSSLKPEEFQSITDPNMKKKIALNVLMSEN